MSYRDRQRPSSWRGVAFSMPTHDREGGRRGSVLEFPKSDKHRTQDLGLAAVTFSVTAVIIGDDYDVQRDAMIKALEQGGPGKLVHKYFGEMQAEIEPGKKYKLTETDSEGRVATFTIPFIRSGEPANPTVGVDSAAKVKASATRAKASSIASFAKKVKTSGPEFVRQDILGTLRRANDAVASVNDKISGVLGMTSGVAGLITSLGNNVAALIASPLRITELAESLYEIQEAFFGAIAKVGNAFKRLAAAVGIGGSSSSGAAAGGSGSSSAPGLGTAPTGSTSATTTAPRSTGPAARSAAAAAAQTDGRKVVGVTQAAQADVVKSAGAGEPVIRPTTDLNAQRLANQQAVIQLVHQAATIEAARAAVDMPYDSHATAIAMRDHLDQALVALAEVADDDDVYAALIDLRVDLSEHLTQAAGALPKVIKHSPLVTLPALLVAHIVHGDATRHEEIVARNNIRHPGFVLGARPVLVLADG